MDLFLDKTNNLYLNTGLLILTIISSALLCIVLDTKKTNYAKIMNCIVLSDSILIYVHYVIWMTLKYDLNKIAILSDLQKFIVFNS